LSVKLYVRFSSVRRTVGATSWADLVVVEVLVVARADEEEREREREVVEERREVVDPVDDVVGVGSAQVSVSVESSCARTRGVRRKRTRRRT
jgi:hypothetical protein